MEKIGGKNPKIPNPFSGKSGAKYESKWVPMDVRRRVSMSAASFSPRSWFSDQILQKEFKNLARLSKTEMDKFLFFMRNNTCFGDFQKPRYQQTTVQKVPAQVLADAPRRVSMSAASFSPRSWFWGQILQKEFQNLARLSNFGIHIFLHLWTIVFLN